MWVCLPERDEKYENVALFLYSFIIGNSHRKNVFLSRKLPIFLQYLVWVHCITATVSENVLVTKLADCFKRTQQPRDGLLTLFIFAHCCIDMLKHGYENLESFSDDMQA